MDDQPRIRKVQTMNSRFWDYAFMLAILIIVIAAFLLIYESAEWLKQGLSRLLGS